MINIKIAVIDADLIGRKNHRFPNLACMKISGYEKSQGNNVILKLDYNNLECFDKVYISKVFTDTYVPENVLKLPNVLYGGTGFFYDKASPLPYYIEHHMPDYYLYDNWVKEQIANGKKKLDFKYYIDYNLGFLTRGCFRKCEFCVNKNYNKVELHSSIDEFLDQNRKYICLLDDNILGCSEWKDILLSLQKSNKRFEFKQGMDIRLMTDEKAKILNDSKYIGSYIFAFDNIKDKDIVEKKLKLWRKYCSKKTKLYIFCGYDRNNKWDYYFWVQDIIDTFERIKVLMKYRCLPYLMRFERYKESPFYGIYVTLSRWCNQPSFYTKQSLRQYVYITDAKCQKAENYSSKRYLEEFEKLHPEIAKKYFDMRFEDLNLYK